MLCPTSDYTALVMRLSLPSESNIMYLTNTTVWNYGIVPMERLFLNVSSPPLVCVGGLKYAEG